MGLNSNLPADIKDLLPVDGDEKNLKSILQFSRIISRLPIGAISKGAFAHATALNLNPKIPFIPPVRDALLSKDERVFSTTKLSEISALPLQIPMRN